MSILKRFARSFSILGIIVGLCLACFSLTPSMLPRTFAVQGLQTGILFSIGYGAGVVLSALWHYMGFSFLNGPIARIAGWCINAVLVIIIVFWLGRMADWQNSIHLLMNMDEIDTAYPVTVAAMAAATALLVILAFRLILFAIRKVVRVMTRILPPRVAMTLGVAVVAYLLVTLTTGVLLRSVLHTLDESFAALDQVLDDQHPAPLADEATGSVSSHIAWDDVGRNGKRFVSYAPTREDISKFLNRPAKHPLRIYAGYNTGDDLEERAQIALNELIRVGGFDRSLLVIAVPTGTGWLDPGAVNTLEYMHAGDTAIVGMQYSYLPSWLTLMVEPKASSRAARALFDAVYGYWTTLPQDQRPLLYLHGLSLGAFGSADTLDFLSILADPIDGAMWSGPPFTSQFWNMVTTRRNSDSPQWRPVYGDSSVVRFMNQDGFAGLGNAEWGPFRFVYLQYASDPMTFFSTDLAYVSPDWLGPDRGPDVSEKLQFYPLVTFLQVASDMMVSMGVPPGYGHNFAPEHYIDAWIEVTQPRNWSDADTLRLKAHFADFDPNPL